MTKSAVNFITSKFEPVKIDTSNAIKEGFLYKRNEFLLTYTKYWAVLVSNDKSQSIYLFKNEKEYDECIDVIDLKSYDKVQAIQSYTSVDNIIKGISMEWSFDLIHSDKQRIRFVAESEIVRSEWIQCLLQLVGVEKLNEIKQSLMDSLQIAQGFNIDCITYYIIDLEFNHCDGGDPQKLLRNENFVIAAVIWSYIHYDWDKGKEAELESWQKPIAIAHGIGGGVKGGIIGSVTGITAGGILGAIGGAVHSNPGAQRYAIVPLTAIAGAMVGVAYGASTGTLGGIIDAYRSVQ